MASYVVLKQVFLEASTAKSVKIRYTNITDNTGASVSFWVPLSQTTGQLPAMYSIADLPIAKWFWTKIREKLNVAPGTLESDFLKSGSHEPIVQPNKPLYEILKLKTPADAKEFIKSLAKYFEDPLKFENYLKGNIIPMSGMIRMSIDIDIKNLLLISMDEFKDELIQAGLQEHFKGKLL